MLNYYQHHIGDHAALTLHLSWDEDCAFRRLLDQYYKREAPIPTDLKEACRLARATTPAQKNAVEKVLREFFTKTDDGWMRPQCQQEIANFQQYGPAREAAKSNRNTRTIRHREQREALFAALAAVGQEPAWNTPISVLREMANRYARENVTGDAPVTPVTSPETPPVTSHERTSNAPVTSTHSPFPIPHSDSESDSEISSDPDTSQARGKIPRADVALRKGKRSTERGTRVPEPFELSEDMRAWAQTETPSVDLAAATAEFVDYWRGIPGAKGRKLDWEGTWRNRMRELAGRSKRNGVDNGGAHESKQLKAWRARKEALKNA